MKTLSDRIRLVLTQNNWSAAELARRGGVSRAAVSDWLAGNVMSMSAGPAGKIADAAGVDALWLMTGHGRADQDLPSEGTPEWPLTVSRSDFEKLADEDKHALNVVISRFIAGCLALDKVRPKQRATRKK